MVHLELFLTFLLIGSVAFGGGYGMIPLVRSFIVEKGWLTSAEISNIIAISESTPGPIAVNMATYVGSLVGSTNGGVIGGLFGSLLATLGAVLPAFVVVIIVANIFNKFKTNKYVNAFLTGIKPVVLALILSTGVIMIIECIYVNFGHFNVAPSFDFVSLALILGLIIARILYKKFLKKVPSPILMIFISAIIGIFIF